MKLPLDRNTVLARAAFRRAAELAAEHGVVWHFGKWPQHVRGQGHAAECAADLCHEIAHFLVSPKYLRKRPYYGLGNPVMPLERDRRIATRRSFELESEAAMLGVVISIACGVPMAEIIEESNGYAAFMESYVADKGTVARLRAKGLWTPEREQAWAEITRKDTTP